MIRLSIVRLRLQILGALCTAVSLLGVHSALMGPEVTRGIKCHVTLLPSILVNMGALEGFLVQMHRRNMFLEGGMLPEGLVTRWIFSTAVLVSPVMSSQVTTESRSRHKTFPTSGAVTDIVANSGMGTLQMVIEMRRAKECFVATRRGTMKESFIVV